MSNSVQMPALGESVTEGTVTRWLKQVGEQVEVDEPLLEVSTDKVDTEIPSPYAGTVEKILADEDETVEVGADLAVIGDGSGAGDEGASDGASDGASEPNAAETEKADAEEAAEDTEVEEAASPQPAAEEPAAEEAAPEQATPEQAAPEQGGASEQGGSGEGSEVTMPALGESVTEGTVTRWLKQVGEEVELDEPLLEVSTDKVDTEIPSPLAGTVQKILVNEDETVEVGAALAVVGSGAASAPEPAQDESSDSASTTAEAEPAPAQEPAAQAPEPAAPSPAPAAQPAPEPEPAAPSSSLEQETAPAPPKAAAAPAAQPSPAKEQSASAQAPRAAVDSGGYVTPLVRKLAAEKNVDLSTLGGTGVGGRIRKQDVLDAAESAGRKAPAAGAPAEISEEAAKLRGTVQKAPRIRQTIAKRMKESLDVSAQLTQTIEVDMTRVAKLRAKAKASFLENEGVKLSFLPFIAKAVTEALKAHPKVNASYDGEAHEITYHAAEHLAIAVDTERGLLVPVIRDAGDLSLAGMAGKIADLAERTRTNKIGPDELSGGTFTITNIGSVGALFDTPIINQPQVGIIGTGAIVKRPVVVTNDDGDDSIAIRSMMYLPLTYDHRLVDGADAGRFLQTIKARLEAGTFESELGL